MPGLAHSDDHYVDGVSYNQLHKFWSELSPKARHELLKIDRQALSEQARKNMCCSKCIGLLLEDFLRIVSNGKSLQEKGDLPCNKSGALKDHSCSGELQDPAVHLWGGLTATRDGLLTLLDCYLYAKSFKGIQNVFNSARAREKERELLYPHACGGQRMVGYGKGHGTRETCALHTTRLSCDALLGFWSALEEESRQSILRMKEEDFNERLTNRFKCKKFCKDCRRNVIREFKELKELKRMQREPQCTDWFCVADTAIQYEVDNDSVRADWSQYFTEKDGYQYIEWGIGTEEGETDILKYKYVGKDGRAQVSGLDLRGLRECYITVRAFKDTGRCSEISVKAHALRGQQCVHSWLVVGDGFVSVKRGECLRTLLEHAEDLEQEEDEVLVDKDGNKLDCDRPQKHAKTPELAREFLLDAATVIFKEQVEKAYREATAHQNAHSIFVCLSCKLLEQRVHVACKEIVTLENQRKLLEEEEKEKLEEKERKGRKRTKEKEKKLRRKERLKEKEREKEQKNPVLSREEEGFLNLDVEMNSSVSCEESAMSPPGSSDDQDGDCLDGFTSPRAQTQTHYCDSIVREVIIDHEDGNGFFATTKEGKKMEEKNDDMYMKDPMMSRNSSSDSCSSCISNNTESPSMSDSEDVSQHSEGREDLVFTKNYKPDCHEKMTEKSIDERDLLKIKSIACKEIVSLEKQKRLLEEEEKEKREEEERKGKKRTKEREKKLRRKERLKAKERGKEQKNPKFSDKPALPRKEEGCLNLDEEMNISVSCEESATETGDVDLSPPLGSPDDQNGDCLDGCTSPRAQTQTHYRDGTVREVIIDHEDGNECVTTKEGKKMEVDDMYLKDPMMSRTSSSDNCSSCLSEGDSSGNTEPSLMSDSEDVSQHSEVREKETEKSTDKRDLLRIKNMSNLPYENMVASVDTSSYMSQPQSMMFPQMPVSQAPGYYHQAPVSWSASTANPYVYTGPLGYSGNRESLLCVQYGTPLNPSATPFFNSRPTLVSHPSAETNTMNTVDQGQTLEPVEHSYQKEATDERISNRMSPVETPSSRGQQTDSDEDFSLFHFSGPIAMFTGSKSYPAQSLQFSGDHVFGVLTGNDKKKESTVGVEYNLFAKSNSLRFLIF